MLGVANVLQPDPDLGGLASPIEQLFAMVAPLIILITGLYAVPLAALAGSYKLIPPGTLLPAADTAETAVRAVAAAFALALRIASPFLLVAIVWHVATGLLARLVPRLQVYFVVMPAQILGGIALLAMLATSLLTAWQVSVRAGFASLPGL
jgi:flagellar biosynthetic protein FliR